MHRGKVDPGVSELPWGNELSRDHVNRPLGTTHCPRELTDPGGQLCLGARSDACNCSHEFFVAPGQFQEAGYPLSNTG